MLKLQRSICFGESTVFYGSPNRFGCTAADDCAILRRINAAKSCVKYKPYGNYDKD
jgi:hypothetical protein